MASALALIARGRPVKRVCEVLGVARSNVAVKLARPTEWQDGRSARETDDASLVEEIRESITHLPSYGYRRVWGILRRQRERQGRTAVNAKRVYRVMRTVACCCSAGRCRHKCSDGTTAKWPSPGVIGACARTASNSAARTERRCS